MLIITRKMSKINKYTPAIDGIRAIAVLSVIINHFNSALLPGGYLGVDMFFVISGFVITSSLVNREETRVELFFSGFYKRRIKRLLPALLVNFLIAGVLISFFNPSPQKHIITGIFSLIGFSNIDLYLNAIDYWGETAKLNPFTHTWSLGVEEQFYLILPLIIWLTVRGNWTVQKNYRLQWMMLVASIISLLFFVFFSESNQIATYFLMPYRFWEIGFGCVLFIYLKQGGRYIKSFVKVIPNPFLLIFTVSMLFIPNDYSILATIAIVCSTLLLILKIKVNEESGEFYFGVLTHKVILYIGVISYSLYLWHWVVIVISQWTIGIDVWTTPFQILLIALLSVLSYHLIEKPFRHTSWRSSIRIQTFFITSLIFVAASIISITVAPKSNFLYLGSQAKQKQYRLYNINSELKCSHTNNNREKQKIRTLGNSHSNHILPMLRVISNKCGLDIIHQKRSDYIVIPSGNNRHINMLNDSLSALNEGDLLILSSRNRFLYSIPYLNFKGDKWLNHAAEKKNKGFGLDNWLMELDAVISKADAIGVNVVLFLPNVEFDQQVLKYKAMCMEEWFQRQPQGCNPKVSKEFLSSRFPKQFYEEVRNRENETSNFYIFDPMPIYCPQEQEECPRIIDGVVAFRDTNHLTANGAKLMLDKFSLFLARHNLIKN
jgi:peptidoglycan/LPS O-acetylase OafA/YrhL